MELLIAAHVMAFECTLISNNTREIRRIKELPLENWAAK
jgi:predicted nucleic acid-binding protein